MHRIFSAMATFLFAFFSVVVYLGFRADLGTALTHISAAIFLTFSVLFLHSLVIFYLIGSGHAIREAIRERRWARPYLSTINVLRAKAFPFALASMVGTILAAWSGAAAHTFRISTMAHRGAALGIFAVNVLSFVVEYAQLRANSRMIAELQRRLEDDVAGISAS